MSGKGERKTHRESDENLDQPNGFPVISVSRCSSDTKSLKIAQEKFSADGSSDPSYHWKVPVRILTENGNIHEFLLEEESMTVSLDDLDEKTWYKVNAGFFGYYRVCYEDTKDMIALKTAIKKNQLSEVDRLGVIDDLFNLVQSGKRSAVEVLDMLKGFKDEESYVVWSSIGNCLSKLNLILADTDFFESHFNPYKMDLMITILEKVGWEKAANEHHTRSLLRAMILTRMGVLGHDKTVEEANRRFQDHLSGKTSIPADLRRVVYCTVAAHGDLKTFEQMKKLFRDAELHEEKERIARSMERLKTLLFWQKYLSLQSVKKSGLRTPHLLLICRMQLQGQGLGVGFL